ncbi:hypothetical protein [Streptomyces sp. 184]|uniref:hypothetical protein n=1 Tax=Streptomyces sp. 184 TaxID=1827526 RepID=UPI003891FF6A
MTSTDDILNQIDAALGDPFVSVDAMRSGAAGGGGTAALIDDFDADAARRARRQCEDGSCVHCEPQPRPDDRPAWQSPYGPAARRRP